MSLSPAVRTFVVLGAAAMALAVTLGAFGAHALRDRVTPERLDVWRTAVQYHALHALGLFVVAWVAYLFPGGGGVRVAGWLMLVGIVVSSGSLYLLVATDTAWLGAVTPIGGVAFIAAWVLLALSAWRG